MFFLRFLRLKPVLFGLFSLAAARATTASVKTVQFGKTTGLQHAFKVVRRGVHTGALTYYEELKKEVATLADFSRTK